MPRKSKPDIEKNDITFKKLATGSGVLLTKEAMISKINVYRNEITGRRNTWLKKMNDDCFPLESRLKLLENNFITKYGTEDFYQI